MCNQNRIVMSASKYYVGSNSASRFHNLKRYYKVNKEYSICVHDDFSWFPDISVEVARHTPIDDTVPRSSQYEKIKRVSEEEFNEYFNGNYTALQEVNIQGGDYFLERSDNDEAFTFHAFFEKPSKHFRISCGQTIGGSDFSLMRENTISARPMTKKRGLHITEEVFCLAYKIVLEFLYSGSTMPGSQDKAFQAIKGLLAPNSKPMEVVVTQESYYKKARGLMLQRKDEIKARLVEMDDKPSKRGELRAEMRAIDYCVSILDKYH